MALTAFDVSASGMRAQRLRMETIANNIANMDVTDAGRVQDGEFVRFLPYRRRMVVFQADTTDPKKLGVAVPFVIEDNSEFRVEWNPNHPHSVKNPNDTNFGKVFYPNVDPLFEMTDMIQAARAYEANASAIDALKSMGASALRILA